MDEIKKFLAGLATLPVVAPLKQLLLSRTFVTSVVVFVVNWLVIHDPASAPFAPAIQSILITMWLALAGKFSIEYLADTWATRPATSDAAKSDILAELAKMLKDMVDAAVVTPQSTSVSVSSAPNTSTVTTADVTITGGVA